MKRKIVWSFAVVWLAVASLPANGQDSAAKPDSKTAEPEAKAVEPESDSAEVAAAIQSYVAAFNAKDVAKLVSHWSPHGVYTSRNTGEQVTGHADLTEEFAAIFAGENVPKLEAVTESIELLSPNVAIERGSATVTRGDDDAVESVYSVVYVKSGGAWLIDRVTEAEIVVPLSNYDQLKELGWLVGEWIDDADGTTIQFDCRWTKNQNYISRTYTVSNGEEVQSSGLQVIGWDPREKRIRSWLFDSNGGFISGTWTRRDDRWVVQSVATLPDGGSGSFTSIFRPLEDGSFTWQKVNQIVDGQLLPNIDEVVVRRK